MTELTTNFEGWWEMTLHSIYSLPVWLAVAGVFVAWVFYLKQPQVPAIIKARFSFIYRLLDNKYYLDKINEVVFARGAVNIGRGLWKESDQAVIDGTVNGTANLVGWFARVLRTLQSGYIYHYAFAMIIGTLAILTFFITLSGGN